jgi:hypothetical protein
MAQVTARYWISRGRSIPRDAASTLISSLSWRGISRFPRRDGGEHAPEQRALEQQAANERIPGPAAGERDAE